MHNYRFYLNNKPDVENKTKIAPRNEMKIKKDATKLRNCKNIVTI